MNGNPGINRAHAHLGHRQKRKRNREIYPRKKEEIKKKCKAAHNGTSEICISS
jgi:hypothetical protein